MLIEKICPTCPDKWISTVHINIYKFKTNKDWWKNDHTFFKLKKKTLSKVLKFYSYLNLAIIFVL